MITVLAALCLAIFNEQGQTANTTAGIYLPAAKPGAITAGGKPAPSRPGIQFVRTEGVAAVFEVGSGCYRLELLESAS